jgi:foldase protein PrsA
MIRLSMIRFVCLAVLVVSATAFAQVKLPTNHQVGPPKSTQAIGKVNGKTITAAEIEPFLWEWYGKAAAQDAMAYVVISQEAQRRQLTVNDAEVEKQIDIEIAAMQKDPSATQSQTADVLSRQGFTRSRLYLRVKENMLLDKIILADFDKHKFVKVSTILVRTSGADAGQLAAAIKKCQDAYDQLKSGQDWDKVLASTTTDQKLLSRKGALGWREVTVFPESVQKEITTLAVGGYTHPAQTSFGIQLFRVDAHGVDAKNDEIQSLKSLYLREVRPKVVSDMKARANAQILLK